MASPARKMPIKRLPMLPAERALKVIAGRWKAVILYHLFDGPLRLTALKAMMPGVTQKVLIQQLREMEEHGLVSRESSPRFPRASNIRRPVSASASSRSCWRSASGASITPAS